jgi:hypothetical protein
MVGSCNEGWRAVWAGMFVVAVSREAVMGKGGEGGASDENRMARKMGGIKCHLSRF